MASSSQGEPLDQRDYEAVQVRMVISVITERLGETDCVQSGVSGSKVKGESGVGRELRGLEK